MELVEIQATPVLLPSPAPEPPPPPPPAEEQPRVEPVRTPTARAGAARAASVAISPRAVDVVPDVDPGEAPGVVATGTAAAAPTFALALPGNAGRPTSLPSREDVLDEKGVSTRARVAFGPVPPYPLDARVARIETDIPVEIVVSATGSVVDARLTRTVGYGLDEATLAAIRTYRFAPALKDGRPVAVRMLWTMKFRLN